MSHRPPAGNLIPATFAGVYAAPAGGAILAAFGVGGERTATIVAQLTFSVEALAKHGIAAIGATTLSANVVVLAGVGTAAAAAIPLSISAAAAAGTGECASIVATLPTSASAIGFFGFSARIADQIKLSTNTTATHSVNVSVSAPILLNPSVSIGVGVTAEWMVRLRPVAVFHGYVGMVVRVSTKVKTHSNWGAGHGVQSTAAGGIEVHGSLSVTFTPRCFGILSASLPVRAVFLAGHPKPANLQYSQCIYVRQRQRRLTVYSYAV